MILNTIITEHFFFSWLYLLSYCQYIEMYR